MSRFEASDSPVDILVFGCSGLPGGPKSNGLIFIVSAGSPGHRAPHTAAHSGHRRARSMCGRGGRPGGGDANEPHIHILRLIFIAAMRGPRALSRPTDPGTSTWPCKHGAVRSVCLSLPREHMQYMLLSPLRHRRPAPSPPPPRPPHLPPPLPPSPALDRRRQRGRRRRHALTCTHTCTHRTHNTHNHVHNTLLLHHDLGVVMKQQGCGGALQARNATAPPHLARGGS